LTFAFESLPPLNIDSEETLKIIDLEHSQEEQAHDQTPAPVLDKVNPATEDTPHQVQLQTDTFIPPEHMKVDDLRKFISDKGLATKDEVKKLKKPELLSLLKK
jgi:hypothetical protein